MLVRYLNAYSSIRRGFARNKYSKTMTSNTSHIRVE